MRKGFLSFLMLAICFDTGEGGGGGVPERPANVTEDEWEGLSNEEREGLLMTGEGERGEVIDDDENTDELTDEDLAAIAGELKPGEADEKQAIDDALSQANNEAEAVPAGEAAPVAAEAGIISDDELLMFRPVVKEAELPISTEVPEALATKLAELEDQFEENELSQKEYQAARDALNREILISQLGSRDEARADKVWEKTQAHFLQSRPAYLQKDLKGNAMFGALGEAVKAVFADPKFANASDMAVLVEADKAVRGLFGTTAPAVKTPEPAKPGVKPAAVRPDVKTLASVPSSEKQDTGGDPFAALDRLSGEAFERALERLTPDQKSEYERRA